MGSRGCGPQLINHGTEVMSGNWPQPHASCHLRAHLQREIATEVKGGGLHRVLWLLG